MENKKFIYMIEIIGAIVLFLTIVLVPFSFHKIETGEIAVVKKFGKAEETKSAGLYFDLWFVKKYEKYDLKTQEINVDIQAYSLDAQTMTASLTIQYKIQADKVMEINEQYGSLEVLQDRFWLAYNIRYNKIDYCSGYMYKFQGTICASNPQVLKDAVKFIGEENVKKYILKVEE